MGLLNLWRSEMYKMIFISIPLVFSLAACSSKKVNTEIPYEARLIKIDVQENSVPGTVQEVYIEPMVDQVQVPGRLDPNGVYYIPPHQEVVEIRRDKYQLIQYPEDEQVKESVYFSQE